MLTLSRRAVRRTATPVLAAVILMAAGPVEAPRGRIQLPPSTLSIPIDGAWQVWWRADSAPTRWPAADPRVFGAIRWQHARAGVEWAQLRMAGTGEAWRVGVIFVRFDPAMLDVSIAVNRVGAGRAGPWSIDDAPPDAAIALNAGQFVGSAPWGWVVHDGRERRPPGMGPLAPAIAVDTGGRLSFVLPDSIAAVRSRGAVREAFQSYPTLLFGDGDIPAAIRDTGLGVDLAHRDSRLAIGELHDGRWIIALTRFEGLGGVLTRLPFGLTVPEMGAVLGAVGARRAVMLDGGISAQLMVRDSTTQRTAWKGFRRVPMGLVARSRRE